MRWLLAGLLFALSVALAIGTVAIRAGNAMLRHQIERTYQQIADRRVELIRITGEQAEAMTPENLAVAMWDLLRDEAARRQESLQ